ncbi:MAG: hypothetical protein QOI23_357, partial [Chloroflexota bacterium]|nr:hypothetical protein [Chloroflexota bacterium]
RMEPFRAHSLVGLVPLFAVSTIGPNTMARLPEFASRTGWFVDHRPDMSAVIQHTYDPGNAGWRMLSIVSPDRLRRILSRMLDPAEFLSDHGIRALSRYHLEHPCNMDLGGVMASMTYEPAESTNAVFGGNSNWRGPVWMPVNYLLVEVLRVYHRYLGPDFKVECPTGSGQMRDLSQVADDLAARLVGIFLDQNGRRPVFGAEARFQEDHAWHDLIPFHEYFNGDTGAGLGASHQTGWTGLVADLIIRRHKGE